MPAASEPAVSAPLPDGCDVFISYSHEDKALAERLSRRIRRYLPPRAAGPERGQARRRLRVFRDVEQLTARAELGQALREQVTAAKNMLLMCSPAAARSRYVDDEVAAFISSHGSENLHVVVTAGEAPDVFPAALRAAASEPLYVDLRPARRWWQRRRQFRDESLRVIAALLDVDYAVLYREDERRTRRMKWSAALAVLSLGLLIGGAWLVQRVPIEHWATVTVPSKYLDSALLPMRDFAVNRRDPGTVIFRGRGAEYARNQPALPIGIIGEGRTESWLQKFRASSQEQLRRGAGAGGPWQPVARFRFTISAGMEHEPKQRWGEGDLQVFGFVSPPATEPRFAVSLRYSGRNADGAPVRMTLPPTAVESDPLQFDPWPSNELQRAGALPLWGELQGQLTTAWNSAQESFVYRVVDQEELFTEGNDGMWIKEAVVAIGNLDMTVGDGLRVDQIEPDAWEEVITGDEWARPGAPPPKPEGVSDPDHAAFDAQVVGLLRRELKFEPELDHQVTDLVRGDPPGRIEVVSVVSAFYNERTKLSEDAGTVHFLRRGSGDWSESLQLQVRQGTTVIDAWVFDDGQRLLLLTDNDGYRFSEDGGRTWRDFNFGESALRNGRAIQTVVAGPAPAIYALVDLANPERANPLFRYERRGTLERLRMAVVQLLGGN